MSCGSLWHPAGIVCIPPGTQNLRRHFNLTGQQHAVGQPATDPAPAVFRRRGDPTAPGEELTCTLARRARAVCGAARTDRRGGRASAAGRSSVRFQIGAGPIRNRSISNRGRPDSKPFDFKSGPTAASGSVRVNAEGPCPDGPPPESGRDRPRSRAGTAPRVGPGHPPESGRDTPRTAGVRATGQGP